MLKNLSLALIFSVMGCSSIKMLQPGVDSSDKKSQALETIKVPPLESLIKVTQETLNPGKSKLIHFEGKYFQASDTVLCSDKVITSHKNDKGLMFILIESYFSTRSRFHCYLKRGDKKVKLLDVEVGPFSYLSERLRVNKKRVFLSKKDQARVAKEQKMLNKLYAKFSSAPYFDSGFIAPLKSKITSYYGTRRIFNNKKKSQHLGTDFRAKVGVEIPNANSGIVVFSGDLFYTGKTVIVDHGMGIFTVYGHLSKLIAQKGDFIPKGGVLALSGATGRVSGPHLHWGVKVHGQYIDGFSLIGTTEKIKELL